MKKYKGTYKIEIKKHTKVRRPMSKYIVSTKGDVLFCNVTHRIISGRMIPVGAVQDIKRGLENPLLKQYLNYSYSSYNVGKVYDCTCDALIKGLIYHRSYCASSTNIVKPKSLLERIKERFR